uniref:Transmembrane protein 106A n=1 Tax=Cyclopterus lumpus TaxID=8103 RepID=A0A8C3AZJ8_CYCLU
TNAFVGSSHSNTGVDIWTSEGEQYSLGGHSSGDSCPTCRGTGRIPRDQLVAVIPCNDVRLKPRRTKLHVCISMAVCLFLCSLILFFLFPRSVTLTPVSVLSVMVFFNGDTVDMKVTNLVNISNENFVPVQIVEFTVQGLVSKVVTGTTKITNMTAIQSRSQKSVSGAREEAAFKNDRCVFAAQ